MAPTQNGRLIFNQVPTGYPEPGKTTVYDTSSAIDLDNVPLNGSVLLKTLVLSADPYLRGRMRDAKEKSYNLAFTLGEPISGFGIGVVLRSEHPDFTAGDHVRGRLSFEEYSIPPEASISTLKKIVKEPELGWEVYVGATGMPGMTAYCAWKEYSQAKKGETVFISGGAGAVGVIVIQLAKQDGMKVIASAGTDEKVQECREMGADVAFNYKTTDTAEVLEKEGPLDVYWDNVGGPTLDAALGASAKHARFIICGMISTYNNKDGTNLKNLWTIFGRSLHIHGFLFSDLAPKYEKEFFDIIPKKIARGELKHREDITRGLEHAGEALLDVQIGRNFGKKVILVAEE
ncbi:NAD-P-binding protein [Moniliophthora roreri MCA 2997]|uniref:NAD-P-binding protein n=1 Tax=Moniliophthora roreri (strain MCA 2997) TaxID=1381753 RepID=V2WWF2_MONRO|nr:NAD-P-binding protein [Moniliophthora roreri MCA 2997]KAI3609059.1 NAD-P-binding protein [Moniliophthora roreri]